MGLFNKEIPIGATALVTGASSGIGLEFSRALASMGINVILVSNQPKQLDDAVAELKEKYPALHFCSVFKNLADADAADFLLEYCHDNNMEVDILINDAGIFNFNAITDTSASRLNLYIDLHVRAVTQLSRAFAADMQQRGCRGYIFNMSSMSCWMPFPGIAAYSATKAYIRVLSRAMYYELKDDGISVTVACPGGIATDLFGLPKNLQRLAVHIGALVTPQKFVRRALRRMFNRRKQYVNGLLNRISIVFVSILPTTAIMWAKHSLLTRYATRH